MSITVEKRPYGGWPNCYRVTNGRIELIVTGDVGPRVIRFGFVGGDNEFMEFPEHAGLTGGGEWRSYGGHRLWHSPETRARTYFPDNAPVGVEMTASGLVATPPQETNCQMQKSLIITMDPDKARVTVEHRLENAGVWTVEMAAWAITVMAPGGVGLAPQNLESDEEGLLPNRSLTLWPYTDMSDARFTWGKRLICVRQEEGKPPTKCGLSVTAGWGAYARAGRLFLKQFEYDEELTYPDGDVSVEIYTNERMLELETLSPLYLVEPGETVSHTESWSLVEGFSLPPGDEEALEAIEKHLD